jgi:hypothetical protein
MDPSFYGGAFASPIRRNPNSLGMPEDQGYGGYSGSGTYVLSPDNSVQTSAAPQPGGFQGFLSSLQQGQQNRRQGGLIGAIGAAKAGGIAGLGKFLL